ncbi:condensation domain-containing protein, partial [Methylopila musalis]
MSIATIDVSAAARAEERKALLASLLRRKAEAQETRHPLSRGQKALWFLHQSAPKSPAYNVAFAARVRDTVDVAALARAAQALVDRHPQLRSTFESVDGEPVQIVRGHQDAAFAAIDAGGLDEPALAARVQAEVDRPFDLRTGPLFRLTLFTAAPDDHVLLLVAHHVVYDAWSLWLNLDELGRLYAAEAGGARSLPASERRTYDAFVAAQEALLASPEGEAQWEFWKTRLDVTAPPLELPLDRPRPPARGLGG